MASTYVNDLRLNEMATGDASGTWGTVTNANLELIGEALGYGTEAITTNADTHTSTVADGATDPARAMFIKYTGTLDSTCTITIAPNTLNRLHFIHNATSGSQSIIIKQGSGATITIPTGDTKAVYLDGAGSGAAVTDAFASLSVVDLKVQDDLSFTSDSAVVSFGADADTTLTHTDGSGLTLNGTNKLMFNDASQFIQGASATVLDIAATDEIELTATLIDVVGNQTISGTLGVTGVLTGTSLDISGDIDVDGITNLDVVDIDGAVDMASTLAVAGNVGIGTSSPSELLSLYQASGDVAIKIQSSAGLCYVVNRAGTSGMDLLNAMNGPMTFGTNGTTRMTITSAGGVEMAGTTTVTGVLTANGGAVFNEGGADVDFRVESDTKTHALFVDGALGNVGIGVVPNSSWASSWTALQLGATGFVGQFQSGATDVTALGSNVWSDGTYKYIETDEAAMIKLQNGTMIFDVAASGSADAAISFTTAMTINNSGNVGIGTSSPYTKTVIALAPTASGTTVNETADFADQFVLGSAGGSANGDRIPLVFNMGSATDNNISAAIVGEREGSGWNTALSFWVNNETSGSQGTDAIQEAMRIDSSGNVAIGHTSTGGSKFAICDGANAQIQFFPEISTDTNLTQHYDPTASAYMNAEVLEQLVIYSR
jgi:hypothetical protein